MHRLGALLQRFGIAQEALPACVNSCAGSVIICGSGRSLWYELSDLKEDADVMAVNDAIMHVPLKLTHAYSNAVAMLPHWIGGRREDLQRRDHRPPQGHHCREFSTFGNYWPWPGHGTSGLNAVYTAIGLGYEKIVLCGMPLDNSGHYFDPPWRGNPDYKSERKYWNSVADILKGSVFSKGGYLSELLGPA